uniref:Uncharacterized protein n=1 Tax=Timema bartmani TaxID=61472 RepID=A0A7R9I736_9NEOP|nr:unnamed protein product [Timema bartmani]
MTSLPVISDGRYMETGSGSLPHFEPVSHWLLFDSSVQDCFHSSSRTTQGETDNQLQVLAHLADYNVYTTLNARNQFKAPTEFGLCLRPTASAVEGTSEDSAPLGLKCLACDSEEARLCWVTAMRLAKVVEPKPNDYHLEILLEPVTVNTWFKTPASSCRADVASVRPGSRVLEFNFVAVRLYVPRIDDTRALLFIGTSSH